MRSKPEIAMVAPIISLFEMCSRLMKYAKIKTNIGSVALNTDARDTVMCLIANIDKRKPP